MRAAASLSRRRTTTSRHRIWGGLHLCLVLIIYLQTSRPLEAQQRQVTIEQQQQQQPVRLARATRTVLSPEERPSCQTLAQSQGPSRRRQMEQGSVSPNTILRDQPATNSSQLDGQSMTTNAQHQQQQLPTSAKQQQQQQPIKDKVDTSERLRQLRQLLVSNNYDAYLVTPNDEHGSEYVADFDRRLRFISGFSGSNGYALITLERAVLFTDGRYALQAELDLDCNWALVVSDNPLLEVPVWVKSHSSRRALRLATDARLMSLQVFDYLDSELKRQDPAFEFALISLDLIDVVWNNLEEHQRTRPSGALSVHQLEFTGQTSWQEKVLKLAELMARSRARYYVISKLDDIAWLLNLRGSDIPMAPLFKAYLLVSRQPVGPLTKGAGSRSSMQPTGADQATRAPTSAQPPTSGGTTSPSVQLSLEQLLSGANVNQLQQQQQQQQATTTGGDLLTLQSPQVVQVPASQLIRVTLYVDLRKVTPQIREHLKLEPTVGQPQQQQQQNGSAPTTTTPISGAEQYGNIESRIQVELKDYDVFIMDFGERFRLQAAANQPGLMQHQESATGGEPQLPPAGMAGGKLLLDAMANVAIHVLAKHYDDRLILIEPLCQRLKSVKNDLEVMGMRQAHWRDSLAIAMLLGQLEHDIGVRKRTDKWTEVSAANELEFYRSLMDHNRGQSFETISAYGPNGAIIHYRPDPSGPQVPIGNQSTFLLDSGGQYLDGTTDITRTVHFGEPSDFQRETYTRVLMGAIDMMSLIFELPLERSPHRLNDLIARRHLFDIGLNYEHGTGHGIGLYSLVHESPALIVSYDQQPSTTTGSSSSKGQSKLTSSVAVQDEPLPIRENMFTSVEPGFYQPNEFGIRLENIVVTQRLAWWPQDASSSSSSSSSSTSNDNRTTTTSSGSKRRDWLRFEPISLVPFEPKLIKFELLSNKQKAWLNSYNLMVRLRMTQQINYYLTRVRQSQNQHQQQQLHQVQVLGTTSGSRLYRRLKEQQQQQQQPAQYNSGANLSSKEPLVQETRQNYMRMEPNKLQQLLEQAHRWIMSKTELIPLDVPQRMRGSGSGSANVGVAVGLDGRARPTATTTATNTAEKAPSEASQTSRNDSAEWPSNKPGDDQWSALGAHARGQRLMLAYMASLPFNDASAARALAATSLVGRNQVAATQNAPTDLNSDEQQPLAKTNSTDKNSNSNSSPPLPAMSTFGQKCAGIECDLLLLEALNSHQRQLATLGANKQSANESKALNDDNQEQHRQQQQQDQEKSGRQSSLMDLFQIRSSSSMPDADGLLWSLVANMWPILGLALIITLQLAVVLYVCGSGSGGGSGDGHGGQGGSGSSGSGASGGQSFRSPPSMSWVLDSGSARRRRASGHMDAATTVEDLHNEPAVSLAHPVHQQQPQQQQQQLPIVITENI